MAPVDPNTGPSTESVPLPPVVDHKIIVKPHNHPESLPTNTGEKISEPGSTGKPTGNEATQPIHGAALIRPTAYPISAPDVPLECDLTSHEPKEPSTENQLQKIPDIETPDEPLDEGALPRAYDKNGFLDDNGYLVEIGDDGKPTSLGDATLFTALAVVALATGNHKPDGWETHANANITGFLNVLLEKSWGKTDFVPKGQISKGEDHPIRHPNFLEWDKAGRSSYRPLSKDSFGSIVEACYYSYSGPNSSAEVRNLAQTLLTKWLNYLILIYWLLPLVSGVFELISSRGNPNGIWAWIAHKKSVLEDQIHVFENSHINQWKYYAYTKNYSQWLKEDVNANPDQHNPGSSRLDYLLLHGLVEKGVPMPGKRAELDLKILWAGFKACIQAMIDDAVAKFKELGKLERQFVDLAGNTVLEVISQVEGFSRSIWKAGKQTSRLLHHLAGEVAYMAWDAVSGSLTHFMRWSKAQADLTMKLEDLVDFQLRDVLSGSKAVWKWANGALDSFVGYAITSINGTVADLQNWTVKQIRSAEGVLKQWTKVSGTLLSYAVWNNASGQGLAKAGSMILHDIKDPSGPLREWIFEAGIGLKSFRAWSKSTDDLGANAQNICKNAVRDAVGGLTLIEKDGERLIRRLVFSSSTPEGIAKSAQCVMYQFRSLDAKIEQWDIDEAGTKLYRIWVNSTLEGVAPAENLLKSVERSDGGKFIIRSFKDGLEFGGQVVDKFGHELEKIGKGIGKGAQDVIGAIGGALGGIHL
ncbi:uncharacterized protein N7483_011364 [Penicillium malachiteum]|uniref:uncharacterized protein n=1 Tax=Penicillium malachiteum TaxID=1324776 RepID=UPI002548E156|nr:uncharacterized protein N7483_011364 [Penicillium malachiteum]KAJ5714183.1 hypothetical protein N7483_011364 [Penicillium malachiteum]